MSKFKVGMDVFDLRFGWVKIKNIDDDDYPISVKYNSTSMDYTKEWKWDKIDVNPSLFLPSEVPKE